MIYKQGQTLEYKGRIYTVGDMVIANADSVYEGLMGRITEIRTGGDKDTENLGPDIYCDFEKPQFPFAIKRFEERFHVTVDEAFDWDMIALDGVIMAPEMLVSLDVQEDAPTSIKIYVLLEDWIGTGTEGNKTYAFLTLEEAKKEMQIHAYLEKEDGIVKKWLEDERFIEDIGEMSYSAYIDGWYCDNHYELAILEISVPITEAALLILNETTEQANLYQDLYEQVESWDEFSQLTEQEQKEFIFNSNIPQRMQKRMQAYEVETDDAYTQELSELAHELMKEFLVKKREEKKNG